MKKIKRYFNTFYPPAFFTLCVGLAIFSITLCLIAINLRLDILAGESDMIYKYPKMIDKILFPVYILLPITMAADLNERNKKS